MKSKLFFIFFIFLLFPAVVLAAKSSDVNSDGRVDGNDAKAILSGWLSTLNTAIDIDGNGKVNSQDMAFVIRDFGLTFGSPTPVPSSTPNPAVGEWTQFGATAARTSWLPQNISNWSFRCITTGIPQLNRSQVITGGNRIYVATSTNLIALNEQCGQIWSVAIANAGTPAYDAGDILYVLSTNGTIYRLNAANGSTISSATYAGTSSNSLAMTGNQLIFSVGNLVYAVNKTTLAKIWQYDAGSLVVTMPAYSQQGITIVLSQDLYAHAINSSGVRLWRVKHTPRVFGEMKDESKPIALADAAYPVVAEQHGIVFIPYMLDHGELYTKYIADNAQIRSVLEGSHAAGVRGAQYLFALNLSDGQNAFTPNIGTAGGEQRYPDYTILLAPPFSPIIRILPNGKEIAYNMCRGRSDTLYDFNWDSSFCEMVMDANTSAGYSAGEVRFVYVNQPTNVPPYLISDEQPNFIGMGNMFVGAHWQAGHAFQITNRSDGLGTWTNKVQSVNLPWIANVETPQTYAPCTQNATHSCSGNLYYDETAQNWGGRPYPPGYWMYWNTAGGGSGENGYTVSKNMIIYTYKGALMILTGTTSTPSS